LPEVVAVVVIFMAVGAVLVVIVSFPHNLYRLELRLL
jgi:hypothetical protein